MYVLDFVCNNMLAVLDVARFALTAIQYVVPVLLILWGTIDLLKSVIAGKEDDIKKNQKVLIRRIISGVLVFFIPLFVKVILGLVGADSWKACWQCSKPKVPSINGDYKATCEINNSTGTRKEN